MRAIESNRLIGERLRQERLLAGKSREELGLALGVGSDFIRAYEHGATRLPAKLLVTAAQVFGVPRGLLFYTDDRRRLSSAGEDLQQRLAVLRPPSILDHPGFAHVRPIVDLWQATRGELTEDVHKAVAAGGLLARMVLVRRPFRSSRLVTQHFGPAIMIMRPCEALNITGRDFDEHHTDREYGSWVSNAYAETLRSRSIRVECVRALVRNSTAVTLRTRYDRVLIPWRTCDDDMFAMAFSIQREVPIVLS